jgi:hypothetical protein
MARLGTLHRSELQHLRYYLPLQSRPIRSEHSSGLVIAADIPVGTTNGTNSQGWNPARLPALKLENWDPYRLDLVSSLLEFDVLFGVD